MAALACGCLPGVAVSQPAVSQAAVTRAEHLQHGLQVTTQVVTGDDPRWRETFEMPVAGEWMSRSLVNTYTHRQRLTDCWHARMWPIWQPAVPDWLHSCGVEPRFLQHAVSDGLTCRGQTWPRSWLQCSFGGCRRQVRAPKCVHALKCVRAGIWQPRAVAHDAFSCPICQPIIPPLSAYTRN